jgi:hypothetical protein
MRDGSVRRRLIVAAFSLLAALGAITAIACYDNDGGTQQDGGGGGDGY